MIPATPDSAVNILMYHSISEGAGPTCIPPETFRAQLDALESRGYQAISLAAFAAWNRGEQDLPRRPVVITFDDGFADFAETAFPEIESRGWTATVFLPVGVIGRYENWAGHFERSPRRLMDWDQVNELADKGIEFGGHSMTHPDLTTLSPDELSVQTRLPQELISEHLGRPTISFAPPYGRTNAAVRNEIRKWYEIAVGVHLNRAGRQCDLFDVPRIEMHYFRTIRRWCAFLDGKARTYFAVRRTLRSIRRFV